MAAAKRETDTHSKQDTEADILTENDLSGHTKGQKVSYSHFIFVCAHFSDQVKIQVQRDEANPGQGAPVCRGTQTEKQQGQITT